MPHPLNFNSGWWLIFLAFVAGAGIGLGFHREDFLGGYGSFRRRLLRLGHIALAALGALNVLYGICPVPAPADRLGTWASALLVAGAIAMPLVCFLASWREPFRRLFFLPVALLLGAVALILARLP